VKYSRIGLLLATSLIPIYPWSSGGLQPSHYILAIYASAYLLWFGVGKSIADILLFVLVLFVFLREGLAVFLGEPLYSLLPVAHITFSVLIFNAIRRAVAFEENSQMILVGIVISAIIAVGGVLIFGYDLSANSEGLRAIGTFNRPNQLGYFAICLFAMAFLFRLRFHLNTPVTIFLVLCSIFLAVASLSNAAMIGIAIALLFVGFSAAKGRAASVFGVISLAIVSISIYWLYSAGLLDDYSFVQRMESIDSQSDNSLAGRGYALYFNGSALALFGGFGFTRTLSLVGHEVHSTLFSFFTYYGVVGGTLFLVFNVFWVRRVWRDMGAVGVALVVLPVVFYGLTHNGSRFAIFWLLLALSFAELPPRHKSVGENRTVSNKFAPKTSLLLPGEVGSRVEQEQ